MRAVHVLGGLAYLAALAARQIRARARALPYQAVRLGGVYWHFMAGLWLVVLAILYLPGG